MNIQVPPHVGSRWYLPSGNVVEILPSLVSGDYVLCKYTRRLVIGPADAEAGVTLRIEFLEKWGKAL
jgi:hypothetical protein